MPNSITTIDLLRHGQTVADDILRGRIDVPLSDNGYQQMQASVAPHIEKEFPWQGLITSPLQRCAKFAHDLAQQHDRKVETHHGFLEMDFGDWDGRPLSELKAENPELFTRIWRDPQHHQLPGGETFQDFAQRISTAWSELVVKYHGQHILLICHGGVIRALLRDIMQTPLTSLSRIMVPYACMSRIQIHHHAGETPWPQLVFHNAHR